MNVGQHHARKLKSSKAAFVELCGEGEVARRQAEIDALPRVTWKGAELVTMRCHGETGKGPHDVNNTEWIAWVVLSLSRWKCPYHV
jgi:hypothetical protein